MFSGRLNTLSQNLQVEIEAGPPLTQPLYGHCMVKTSEETAMIIGGKEAGSSLDTLQVTTYSYNSTSNEFSSLKS